MVLVLSACFLAAYLVPQAVAQLSSVVCMPSWNWTLNSLGQTPCKVASYLETPCSPGGFNIDPLQPDHHYIGPVKPGEPCDCSTVLYSLVSACASCQNETYITWSLWSLNCTSVWSGQYSETIPLGTAVPSWAYLNVSTSTDTWNPVQAQADLGGIESTAIPSQSTESIGSTSSLSSTSLYVSTTSSSTSSQPSPTTTTHPHSSSNVGAIAGGVVGGVVGLGLLGGLIAFFLIRYQRAAGSKVAPSDHYGPGAADTYNGGFSPVPPSAGFARPPQDMSQPRLYNPNDPSTFPGAGSEPSQNTMYTTVVQPNRANMPGNYTGTAEL